MTIIYKLCPIEEWIAAQNSGKFGGSAVDKRDGYIHFSSGGQLRETARRHFTEHDSLVLLAVDASRLGDALKWEPSRGGDLFPHLYAPMPLDAVTQAIPLTRDPQGEWLFPQEIP